MKPDKNYLPPELAAQILEREALLESHPLDEGTRELLVLLIEECAEVQQRATKILRFGFTVNPWTGKHNRAQLELELGDLVAAIRILHALEEVDWVRVCGLADMKIEALRVPDGRLRHAKVPRGA